MIRECFVDKLTFEQRPDEHKERCHEDTLKGAFQAEEKQEHH